MSMKKIGSIILVILVCFTLCSCSTKLKGSYEWKVDGLGSQLLEFEGDTVMWTLYDTNGIEKARTAGRWKINDDNTGTILFLGDNLETFIYNATDKEIEFHGFIFSKK